MMNKKADKIISVYWFVILALVAGGIFGMVYIYYGTPYDTRTIEAKELTGNIADCVSYGGKINANLLDKGKFSEDFKKNFLKECHLIFNSTEWDEEQFYSEVNFYKINDMNNPLFSINAGNNKWLSSCAIQGNKEEERLAKCNSGSFYSVDSLNNQYIIKILSVVRKAEKNVKL